MKVSKIREALEGLELTSGVLRILLGYGQVEIAVEGCDVYVALSKRRGWVWASWCNRRGTGRPSHMEVAIPSIRQQYLLPAPPPPPPKPAKWRPAPPPPPPPTQAELEVKATVAEFVARLEAGMAISLGPWDQERGLNWARIEALTGALAVVSPRAPRVLG